ncbi:MAG: Eco57I restriction-modification methylase domain-containing protein [Proteobacteria bacterium]|nr:Eco57I restriction-modification methylase domain-containing protein [Pseudomonadota bacterium]
MKIDAAAVRKCLKSFDFATLFREHLGWDNHNAQIDIPVDGTTIRLTAVAQKRGFVAFLCPSIPDRPTRLKIDHKVTKSVHEHFVIYTDQAKGRQVWHWVRREPGKPLASRDHRFDIAQSGDPLIQRLDQIAVSMVEEEAITVVDVAGRVRAALDVDKITKKFYDRFKAEHAAFLKLITGFPGPIIVNGKKEPHPDHAWYTSLMLNRLMFVYFIQKKGFLDGDTDYLRNRLKMVQNVRGKDKFQTFYRYFLLRLFHEGLGRSPSERKLDAAMGKLLGKVSFLNGGFFEVHQLEEQNPDIDIPDKAFEGLFAFFEDYRWHLDERPLRADNEINPDVVGYIFEKYINQKQMGAYYTKEDITEYISKNTLIPFLFDAAEKKCPIAFAPDGFLWKLLRDEPDRYIYPAVKHGVIRDDGSIAPESELPDFVQTGMNDPRARMHDKRYNLQQTPAGDPLRLVTETWREYVCRRTRCLEIREKLRKGEVHQINDLITLNLDIWQFARDAIVTSEGPELLRAFWQAIAGKIPEKSTEKFETGITVLDPTCGSGAFLFAALRILETLYSDCLERMARFIEDIENKPHHPKQFTDFKEVLAQIGKHPGERYFILKSIIINNLFGVDIMAEAVEICKLRLFLKLMAQVETAEQIEPLPDMDFNIRTGNTLVGYATEGQARKAFTEKAAGKHKQATLLFGETVDAYRRFEEDLLIVEKIFQQFRAQQTTHGGRVTHKDKQDLRQRLENLDTELDRYLASEYGIAAGSYKSKATYEEAFSKWKDSHKPFHWFVEFYGIMHSGGFDVIIGNPPYVEWSKVKSYYLHAGNYTTLSCGNLFTAICERSYTLTPRDGRFGMIVPVSCVATERMLPLRELWAKGKMLTHASFYSGDAHPSVLFNGVKFRLTILLQKMSVHQLSEFSTHFQRWYTGGRELLFPLIEYTESDPNFVRLSLKPKLCSRLHFQVLSKLMSEKICLGAFMRKVSHYDVYSHRIVAHFVKAMDFVPYFCSERDGIKRSEDYKIFGAASVVERDLLAAVLNSSVFYQWFVTYSDVYHCGREIILDFPLNLTALSRTFGNPLRKASAKLMESLRKNSVRRKIPYQRTGIVEYDEFYPKLSKPIIDQIDHVLAQHYGFTDEELDFIINYDIKYRMGRDGGNEGEE